MTLTMVRPPHRTAGLPDCTADDTCAALGQVTAALALLAADDHPALVPVRADVAAATAAFRATGTGTDAWAAAAALETVCDTSVVETAIAEPDTADLLAAVHDRLARAAYLLRRLHSR